MSIRSGIGIGEAQVFDTSGIMNTYNRLLKKQQEDQTKYESQLADTLSKVDLKNLDPRDSKYILDNYGSIKDMYGKLAGIKDKSQQLLAMSQLSKQMDEINQYANNAKAWRKNITDVALDINRDFDAYDDDVKNEVQGLVGGSYADAVKLGKAAIDPFTYKRSFDASLVDKSLDGFRKDVELNAKTFKEEKTNIPGYKVVVKEASPDAFAASAKLEIAANSKLRYQYKELYKQQNPQAAPPTNDDLVKFAKGLYEAKYKDAAYRFAGEPKKETYAGPSKSELKEQNAVNTRAKTLSRLKSMDPSATEDVLNMSDLPYGSSVVYAVGKDRNGITRNNIRVTIPKSDYQELVDAGVDVSKYGWATSSDKKAMILDFDVDKPDFERGFNVFLNKFTPGTNVQYNDIKGTTTKSNRPVAKQRESIADQMRKARSGK